MDFSLVIPVYNEADNIDILYRRVHGVLSALGITYEVIFVNDGSQDHSIDKIKSITTSDDHFKYIDLSRNFGHQIAVSAGLDHATGEYIGIMDADLQDAPELIPQMLDIIRQGHHVVYAKRASRAGESYLKKWTAALYYRVLSSLTSVDIPLDSGDFRIIHRDIVEVLKQMPERNKFLRGQIAWAGFSQVALLYHRDPRNAGNTGYSYRKMIRLAIDGITSFSNVPLKIVTYFGILISVFAFITALFVLYSIYVIEDYVPGWGSLMISILFIGGVQMIAIGIIGEYLSRMNQNILQRPLYVVKDKKLK